ncbi:lytic polysaccharide monooxygenase [Hypoxylon rubiginosum]|uniref:Lytic polysaccharide monooxygenase n=1 Tax=Hypoxylon rubiginosum TaxID=110542 RepID=A0ACB9Z1X7_9PEZI|nr:lytic polysaccharide monooxygenase [Hypoxylon rubiginosum]
MVYAKIAVTAGLIAAVNAHMKMKTPAPFDPSALNNSPLDASGSDFPCKFGNGYSATGGETNSYELGSSQTLSFTGQATHGGGSCQVAITYDESPTKDSVFKVIHSIEGGCPAKDTSGNLGDSADADDPFTYPYTIPSDIPAGKATIAWTWFNKVGNREMYMNCGALELTGTGGDQANFDKLPDMLVLNIAGKPSTLESYDYKFQDAGSSVEDNTSSGQVATCGTDGCTQGDTAGSSGSGSGSDAGSGSGSDSGSGSSATTTSAAAAASTTAAAGGVFITQPGSGSGSEATATATAVSSPTSTAADVPAATATAGSGSTTGGSESSSGSAMTGACSPEGTFNCMGSSYQQCASGQWSVTMALAAGTSCSGGQSTSLNIAAAGKKRSGRSFRA